MSEKLLELVKKGESEEVEFKNKRVGTENIVVPPEELERIILNKHEQEFDSKICKGASYEDIDLKAVKWFKGKYKEVSGKELQGSNIDILKSLDCVSIIDDKLKPTNAGILLFGKYPQKFFTRYYRASGTANQIVLICLYSCNFFAFALKICLLPCQPNPS